MILGIVFGSIGGILIIILIIFLVIRYRRKNENNQIDSKAIDLVQFS